MDVGKYIKELRLKKDLSQEELGRLIGVQRAAVQKWESGKTQNLKRATINLLAEIFEVSPANFVTSFDNTDKYSASSKAIPLLGKIACGEPIYCNNENSIISVDGDFDADFCVIAKGDSMINARIFDGDFVFCKAQQTVENGEIAAVIVDDEATLKRVYYYPEQDKLILNAENSKYQPLVYSGQELNKTRIIGKAVALQGKIN